MSKNGAPRTALGVEDLSRIEPASAEQVLSDPAGLPPADQGRHRDGSRIPD